MNVDLEIAQKAELQPITEISEKLGIADTDLEQYGRFKAKLPLKYINEDQVAQGNLVLVSAMSPTPAGEGKTTVSIGLTDGLNKIGKKTMAVLREPSLGPVFGMKGGAAGGGYSQVVPMEDINLHFTGDFAAIEKANNLLAAAIDNNIQHGKRSVGLDPRTVLWKRVMDMNDRALRQITIGLGGTFNGVPREDGFNITPASEIMAILCLSNTIDELKERIDNILVGFTFDKKPVFAKAFGVTGAMAILLKDAIKPNLVQTLEGNPAMLHGGPFANIAQGTNSIIGTKMGLSLSDYVVTEAGFGADLGAEKFFDIKCRYGNLKPKAVVLVATVKALKFHGGVAKDQVKEPNVAAMEAGMPNLRRHITNMRKFGVNPVVAINTFPTDTQEELNRLKELCSAEGVRAELSQGWAKGGAGCTLVAQAVVDEIEAGKNDFKLLYDLRLSFEEKVEAIAKRIYGAARVNYSAAALKMLKSLHENGLDTLPVCIAKTQYSFSDNAKAVGAPKDFVLHIRDIEVANGAGFLVPIAGKVMRMPGLPLVPAAEQMDLDSEGNVIGLS
ncbi:formate--tetrahydrofolate ligase [Sediminicola luteus]|uniref:Formate--tetrahydrofolate ligase n=1 Tax=Sediminicola luteus TaxID=319238 RepID=A0A2A4G4M8_9FLAO|nr:formate--tetrahydrofolate ligase [Sediminicola luteus]PCE63919.1 formate--tetrahydrofolate ligase [Sediminicola luteus]